MNTYILVHGWGGNPKNNWFPAMQHAIEEKGAKVIAPEMPNTNEPIISVWVRKLQEVVPKPNDDTFFIGHSIGCQTILRYLETLPEGIKVGSCYFFAPWLTLKDLESDDEWKIAKPWLETPIDYQKVKSHCNFFESFFSDDDPFVPITDAKLFASRLQAVTHIEHAKGHYDSLNVSQYPFIKKL